LSNYYKNIGEIAFLGVILLVLTRVISEISFQLAQPMYQILQHLDPDGSFLYIAIHHILQGLFAVFVILVIAQVFRIPITLFGFNLNDWQYSIRTVLRFSFFWLFLQGSVGVLLMIFSTASAAFHFPLTVKNFIGYFAFQILLSGTSEEILFRALVMTPLILYGKHTGMTEKTIAWIAGSIATIIFMLAHINIAFYPLRVTHFNILQQITVLIFGAFYAFLFIRTKSLLGSILAHNLLNAVIVTIGLILFLIFG